MHDVFMGLSLEKERKKEKPQGAWRGQTTGFAYFV
jgi:hypothetical protein